MINIEWPQLSAIAASAGVIIALTFHIKNLKHARLSNSAKMVLDLVAQFDSADMRHKRSRFATALLSDARDRIDASNDAPVLQFFEEIAYMTKRGVLDRGMVWNSFFWYFECYYPAVTKAPDLIEEARRHTGSSTLYREIRWLYPILCAICAQEEGSSSYTPPSDKDIKAFLGEESALDIAGGVE